MGDHAVAGDARGWVRDAFLDPNLAADVLLSFRRRSRVDPAVEAAAEGDERPSTSKPPPPVELLGWGRRIRRSSVLRLPRTLAAATREEEEEMEMEDAATTTTTTTTTTEKRKGKRRTSPRSPLEGYSSASVSGDEEGARAERSTGVSDAAPVERHAKVVVTSPRAPSVPPIAIRRPSSKKMTKLELQTVERTLLEEKTNILKELERWRRAVDELRSNNVKLQAHRELARKPGGFHMVIEDDVRSSAKCQPVSPSSLTGRKDFITIPDLNDPISEC